MRNVNIYLLKILLLVGLFIGCDKMLPNWEKPLVPLWEPLSYEEIPTAIEVPEGSAILIQTVPTNRAITQHVGGIVLEFDKEPENFKTDPPLESYFADEVDSQLEEWHHQNVLRLRLEGADSLLNPYVYIIGAPTIRDEDRIKRLLSDYWGPDVANPDQLPRRDHSISVIDVSWGPAHTQRTARLAYIVIGPE
jgi:hypothetical protein